LFIVCCLFIIQFLFTEFCCVEQADEVVLLFSVAGTKSWKGYAVMTSAAGDAAAGGADGDPSAFPAFSGCGQPFWCGVCIDKAQGAHSHGGTT
jgi:hypothetical protein